MIGTDGWEVRTVGSLGSVRGGKRLPKGRSLTVLPTPHPYVRVTDMRQGGVDTSDLRFVPEDVAPSIRAYRIFKDDIFISVAGTLGIVGRIPAEIDGANLTENADRITSITCDVDYLMYSLLGESIQNEIDSIRTVGAQPKLALGRIKQFEIPIPKARAEQKRIAQVFGDADDLIAALERMIAKKRAIKQGMMQELLTGRTRLPGFTDQWGLVPVGLLGDVVTGGTPSTANDRFWGGEIPWITPTDIRKDSRTAVAERTLTSEGLSQVRALPAGAVLVTCIASIGKNAVLNKPGACNQQINAVIPRSGVCGGDFFYYAIEANSDRLAAVAGTTATAIVSKSAFSAFELFVPSSVDEQQAIAGVLKDIDGEIESRQGRLAKARAIKTGMMQQLLTGRTRLSAEHAGEPS